MPVAAATDTRIAAITQLVDGFNTGNAAMVAGSHTADAVVIDEFAPHVWSGAGAGAVAGACRAGDETGPCRRRSGGNKLSGKLARPERFERPTLRFVV